MGKTISTAMKFEKTGTVKSKRRDIIRGEFKEMSSNEVLYGAIRELYGRFSTEIFAFLLFGSWGLYIWVKLG